MVVINPHPGFCAMYSYNNSLVGNLGTEACVANNEIIALPQFAIYPVSLSSLLQVTDLCGQLLLSKMYQARIS